MFVIEFTACYDFLNLNLLTSFHLELIFLKHLQDWPSGLNPVTASPWNLPPIMLTQLQEYDPSHQSFELINSKYGIQGITFSENFLLSPVSWPTAGSPGIVAPCWFPWHRGPLLVPRHRSSLMVPRYCGPLLAPWHGDPCWFPGIVATCWFPGIVAPSWSPGTVAPCWLPGVVAPCWFPGIVDPFWFPGIVAPCWFPGIVVSPVLWPDGSPPRIVALCWSPSIVAPA